MKQFYCMKKEGVLVPCDNPEVRNCEQKYYIKKADSFNYHYQVVNWFPQWQGIGFKRIKFEETDLAYVYKWLLWIGFWEIRKWQKEGVVK